MMFRSVILHTNIMSKRFDRSFTTGVAQAEDKRKMILTLSSEKSDSGELNFIIRITCQPSDSILHVYLIM